MFPSNQENSSPNQYLPTSTLPTPNELPEDEKNLSRRQFIEISFGLISSFLSYIAYSNIRSNYTLSGHMNNVFNTMLALAYNEQIGFEIDNEYLEKMDYYTELFDLDPKTTTPIFQYWSEYKSTGFFNLFKESSTAVIQTLASNLPERIQNILKKFPFLSNEKIYINSRTFGFYDKGSTLYALAIQNTSNFLDWNKLVGNNEFMDIINAHADLHKKIEEYKIANDTIETPFDNEFIEQAQNIERILIAKNNDIDVQFALTAACIKRQEEIFKEKLPEFNNLKNHDKALLLLITSDSFPSDSLDYSNVKTMFDFYSPERTTIELVKVIRTFTPTQMLDLKTNLRAYYAANPDNDWGLEDYDKYIVVLRTFFDEEYE